MRHIFPSCMLQTDWVSDSALATIDHGHHKLRRAALNPFFSTQVVRSLQPVVEERADALLAALLKYVHTHGSTPVDVMYPFSAFTNGTMPVDYHHGATLTL